MGGDIESIREEKRLTSLEHALRRKKRKKPKDDTEPETFITSSSGNEGLKRFTRRLNEWNASQRKN